MNNKSQIIANLLESMNELDVWSPIEPKYFGPSTRTLALFGEIEKDAVLLAISQLKHLETLNQEEAITLYLNTEGGSLSDAFALYDCIKNLSCPVIIVATGLCASAGLLILSAGDYRAATASTIFYYHQPVFTQHSFINSQKDMQSLNDFYSYCQNTVDDILKETTGISQRKWKTNFDASTGYYFDANKALKLNFIDKIISSNKLEFEIDDSEELDG